MGYCFNFSILIKYNYLQEIRASTFFHNNNTKSTVATIISPPEFFTKKRLKRIVERIHMTNRILGRQSAFFFEEYFRNTHIERISTTDRHTIVFVPFVFIRVLNSGI